MSEEITAPEVQESETVIENSEPSEDLKESIGEELSSEESEEESDGESEEVSEDGEVDPAEENQAELKEYIKTLKLKVNGKEVEEELPFEIDPEHAEYLIKKLQMAAAGQEAMRSKAESDKDREAELSRLKEDPYAVLEELGLDPDELAELRIQQRIEEMQKSPEQLQQEEMEKELEDLRSKLKNEEEAKKEAEFEKLQKETEVQLTSDIEDAISSHTKLPKEPIVVRRIADAMLWAMDNGYPDVKAGDIAPIVEKEITKEYQKLVEMLPENALETFMGKQAMERLRKGRIAKSKAVPKNKIEDVVKGKSESKAFKKKLSMKDFLQTDLHKKK